MDWPREVKAVFGKKDVASDCTFREADILEQSPARVHGAVRAHSARIRQGGENPWNFFAFTGLNPVHGTPEDDRMIRILSASIQTVHRIDS